MKLGEKVEEKYLVDVLSRLGPAESVEESVEKIVAWIKGSIYELRSRER